MGIFSGCKSPLELIKSYGTTYEFSKEMPPESEILKILEAGAWAQSPMNIQPWKFILIKDGKIISSLMGCVLYGFLHEKPQLIIALALDMGKVGARRPYGKGKAGHDDSLISLGVAALLMDSQAKSMGIGCAMLTPVAKRAHKIIGLAKNEKCFLMLALGYGKKGSFVPNRQRNGIGKVVDYRQ